MSVKFRAAAAGPSALASRQAFGACWFRTAFVVFTLGVIAGLLFSAFGPVPFIRALGHAAALAGALGMLVAFAGCRHFRRQEAPMTVSAVSAITPHPESGALAAESATTERLPVWPGVTQPV